MPPTWAPGHAQQCACCSLGKSGAHVSTPVPICTVYTQNPEVLLPLTRPPCHTTHARAVKAGRPGPYTMPVERYQEARRAPFWYLPRIPWYQVGRASPARLYCPALPHPPDHRCRVLCLQPPLACLTLFLSNFVCVSHNPSVPPPLLLKNFTFFLLVTHGLRWQSLRYPPSPVLRYQCLE